MKTEPETISIRHDPNRQRFEAQTGEGPVAFLSYVREQGRVVFDHTFVPEALRGRGVAAALARAALAEASRCQWKIVPRCSYVAAFIERHQEFRNLVD